MDEGAVRAGLPAAEIDWIFATREEVPALSDRIRIALLRQHGGVWADATAMCARPLDEWLPDRLSTGFFAFERPGPFRMLASWFLAAAPDNFIVQRWREACIQYWDGRARCDGDYFWFHEAFEALYATDPAFKDEWDATPKLPGDHLFHFKPDSSAALLTRPITEEYVAALRSPPQPVFKLTNKLLGEIAPNSLLEHLIAFGAGGVKP